MSKVVHDHHLKKQRKGATMPAQIPDGMMMVSVAEYERMRRALVQLQQTLNPFFGLDKLQTSKQRRRDGAR